MKSHSFSRVVGGGEPVARAFDSCPWARAWWQAILWLHGKPAAPDLSDDERRRIIAAGFRFYAALYRFLGILFALVGAICGVVGVFETANQAIYGIGASVLASGFLFFASSLGFVGAKTLSENDDSARLLLAGFMVAVVTFLSAFVGVTSVVVQWQTERFAALNLCVAGIVWCFGIGSYGIEVLYLVAETRLDRHPKTPL